MSFVEVSPSTEIAWKLESAAAASVDLRNAGVAAASVSTNASIVAMFGWIIPAPFAIPTTLPRRPLHAKEARATFGPESVVRIACAAASTPDGERRACASGRAARIFRSGRTTPMTPVDATRTSRFGTRRRSAAASRTRRAASRPGFPVTAFAQPAFTTTARTRPPLRLQVRPAEDDRRRLEAVLREQPRGVRALLGDEEREVRPPPADPRAHSGRAEALRQPHDAPPESRRTAARAARATWRGEVPPVTSRFASARRTSRAARSFSVISVLRAERGERDAERLRFGDAAPHDLVGLAERDAALRERVRELRREETVVRGRRRHPVAVEAQAVDEARERAERDGQDAAQPEHRLLVELQVLVVRERAGP